jgi:hypothetical protein
VDTGFSEGEMVSLAKTFAHTNIASVPQLTYPTLEVQVGSYPYQGYLYGDVEFPIEPTGVDTINQIFGVAGDDSIFTGKLLPYLANVTISVQDGTGVASQAALISTQLAAKGFHVLSTGADVPVGAISETVVWYGGPPPPPSGAWNSPALADAQAVLDQLQGPAILGYDPAMVTTGAAVTVETGTDLSVKTAVVPATTTTTLKSSSTTTTSAKKSTTTTTVLTPTTTSTTTTTIYDPPGVSTNTDFSAPNPTNQALEPYDPRACNAAGTGP